MGDFRVISADSHVREPVDLWQRYMEPAFRERAPRLVSEAEGDYWHFDGHAPMPVRANNPPTEIGGQPSTSVRYADYHPGGWDPDRRIADMDRDGVSADVLYSSLCMDVYQLEDVPYVNACFRAYNRWLADYCGRYPDRLKGIGLATVEDVEAAIAELPRMRDLGLAGVGIGIEISDALDYDHPRYDPFWAAAEAQGLPVSFHSLTAKRPTWSSRIMVDYAAMPNWVQRAVGAMIFSGVFERFPNLTVISVESDAGWIGNWLERADHVFGRYRNAHGTTLKEPPSFYFKRNVKATFMRDRCAMLQREVIGVDVLMWSNDYPHIDSTWPDSRSVIARDMGDLSEADRRRILGGNAADLYGFA
jgi:predicted TIM-barrel fold metal-dependent hydrolase